MNGRRTQPESVRVAFQSKTKRFLSGISDSPGELRECPDQFLGLISKHADGWENVARLSIEDKPKDLPCVLLILESPHKDEYDGASPKPANGPTGCNIAKHLLNVNGLSQYSDHGLVLINAVQYQCSRGKPPKDHRDACFRHIWENGGRADFIDRLKAIQSPGDVFVNACTRGTREKPLNEQLRCLVHSAVLEIAGLLDAEPYRRNHPASWRRKKNRDYEWTNYP